jgi:hypothetical protein
MKKHRPSVQLPDGEDIGTLELTQLIAMAIHPNPENLQGVDCIRCIYKETEFGKFPFKLSPVELEQIELLLPSLPPLRGRMSTSEVEGFFAAYQELTNKPIGDLVLVSTHDANEFKQTVEHLNTVHQDALRNRIRSGSLSAYTHEHLPANSLGSHVFISRSDAISYLTSINLLPGTVPAIVRSVSTSNQNVVHRLDTEAPNIPPRTRAIGRIAIKAAWQIQNELQRPANPIEAFHRLIEWWQNKSSLAGGVIVDFDPKNNILKWAAPAFPKGKPFKVSDCDYVVKKWQKNCQDNAPKF